MKYVPTASAPVETAATSAYVIASRRLRPRAVTLMLPAMLGVMLYRKEEYSAPQLICLADAGSPMCTSPS